MGTYSTFEGQITIDPPLNWVEIRKAQEQSHVKGDKEISLVIDQDEKETDLGTETVKTCSALEPVTDSPYKGYYVEEAVRQVVKACPGHSFSGYLQGIREDSCAMWRIVAKGREVTKISPEIFWPMP